jgi:hypothetical protein
MDLNFQNILKIFLYVLHGNYTFLFPSLQILIAYTIRPSYTIVPISDFIIFPPLQTIHFL